MEAVIVGYRKIFNRPEPEFALILDEDIILDHEIAAEYMSGGVPKESRERQLMGQSRGSSDEPAGRSEMPVDEGTPSGSEGRRIT